MNMKDQLLSQFQAAFGCEPDFIARAPGRIEFIGNHTDYNGGTVLGASIDRGVWVGLKKRTTGQRRFHSAFAQGMVSMSTGAPVKQSGEASWTNYPLGVLAAMPSFGLSLPEGFDFLAASDLPAGGGLSSSAALELASALVFLAATNQNPSLETLVKIGKHAENNFVGVPCGILDQGVSGYGRKNHLVYIDCRGPKFETVPLPSGVHFWIFNTHTKHALVDGKYKERNQQCQDAAKALKVPLLVDASVADLDAGRGLLSVESYKRAKHVIDEIARVAQVKSALAKEELAEVGRLLTASHRSSQTLFENSTTELDFLVDALTAAPNVYGSRLTGGGFGGAVMAMTNGDFDMKQAQAIAAAYTARFGSKPDILHTQTGNGAERMQ